MQQGQQAEGNADREHRRFRNRDGAAQDPRDRRMECSGAPQRMRHGGLAADVGPEHRHDFAAVRQHLRRTEQVERVRRSLIETWRSYCTRLSARGRLPLDEVVQVPRPAAPRLSSVNSPLDSTVLRQRAAAPVKPGSCLGCFREFQPGGRGFAMRNQMRSASRTVARSACRSWSRPARPRGCRGSTRCCDQGL